MESQKEHQKHIKQFLNTQPMYMQDGEICDYVTISNHIRIGVKTFWQDENNKQNNKQFAWAYKIRIENLGDQTVQLTHRTWNIIDAKGEKQNVNGEGVIGKQPILEKETAFEYMSGVILSVPSGFMTGYYTMKRKDQSTFKAKIPPFSLDQPNKQNPIH